MPLPANRYGLDGLTECHCVVVVERAPGFSLGAFAGQVFPRGSQVTDIWTICTIRQVRPSVVVQGENSGENSVESPLEYM